MKKLTRKQEIALAKRLDEYIIARLPRYVLNGGVKPWDGVSCEHKPHCISRTHSGFLCNCQCDS